MATDDLVSTELATVASNPSASEIPTFEPSVTPWLIACLTISGSTPDLIPPVTAPYAEPKLTDSAASTACFSNVILSGSELFCKATI